MYSNASSPGPGYSPSGTPTKKQMGFFDSLRKALPRADSPASTFDGSEAGTPQRGMFPSFTNGQRKREVIKKLEEDASLLNLQVHQQEQQIAKLQQQLQQEEAAKVDAQERLNMQYFKANLVADMLVMRLLGLEQGMLPARAQQAQQQAVAGPGATAGSAGGSTAAVMLEESSF